MKPAGELKLRTKKFALRIVKVFQALPRSEDARKTVAPLRDIRYFSNPSMWDGASV
jgi:hypothetical protein